jgi:rubrerythrin
MNLYICEICGDAYIGRDLPSECPFCGARHNFIKAAHEADPIINRSGEIGESSRKFLEQTYNLEVSAVAIYNCMAGKAKSYEIRAMYKRLAKIELEHATVATKLLGRDKPEIKDEECSGDMQANFQRTLELEDHAAKLYTQFAREAEEEKVRVFFAALAQVEAGHETLIRKYLV